VNASPAPPLPATIPDAIAQLDALVGSCPASDGVATFGRLYGAMTKGAEADLEAHDFQDPVFFTDLDVNFAVLFFTAYNAYQVDPSTAARAWVPLFEARSRHGIAPVQFALAGMNAHINRDLAVALVATCKGNGTDLSTLSPEHTDYQLVDKLLAQVEQELKGQLLTGWLGRVDAVLHKLGGVDDVVAIWDISRARDAAWTNARALWALQTDPKLAADFVAALDRMVELSSRALLSTADGFLQRFARGVSRLFAAERFPAAAQSS
jgi:Family of unknown function (DUF5995)